MPALRDNCLLDAGLPAGDFAFLRDAMKNGQTVNFMYDGKLRVVEVHALGRSPKDRSILMRGYQVAGTASRPLPQWTLFTVDKIANLTHGTAPSQAPREGYALDDAQMSPVLSELAL